MKFISIIIVGVLVMVLFSGNVKAQTPETNAWYMAGANPERTSYISQGIGGSLVPQWYRPIDAYIPAKAPLITSNGLVYVTTARGLVVLNATTGALAWRYDTEMPLGNAPTVIGNTLYVGGMDHKLYCLNALTGQYLWSYEATQGFETNPLVVGNLVILGNRDGYLYAVDTSSHNLAWKFKTDGPILFSAAYNSSNNAVYFASQDSYAYAVNAGSGVQIWKSAKLPGYGFHSWWPVVYTDPQTSKKWVVFAGSQGYRNMRPGIQDYFTLTTEETDYFFMISPRPNPAWLPRYTPVGPTGNESGNWAAGTTTVNTSLPNVVPEGSTKSVTEYLENKPWRRTYFVLDAQDGHEYTSDFDGDGKPEYAPVLWAGTHSGNRYPPVVGRDGVIYQTNDLASDGYIARAELSGWKIGTPFVSLATNWQAVDEPQGYLAAGDYLYFNLCCDRNSGSINIKTPTSDSRFATYFSYDLNSVLPGYGSQYLYDDPFRILDSYAKTNGTYGGHGTQNPPIPYQGRVYMHRSNAVIAFGTQSPAATQPLPVVPAATLSPVEMNLPTNLTQKLDEQIQMMLDAGHLRTGFYTDGIPGQVLQTNDCNLGNYFHNPADTIYTLLRALPYVSTSKQSALRNYITSEFSNYSPLTRSSIGFAAGAARETYTLPAETEADRVNFPANSEADCHWPPNGWSRNPFNLYAVWKYAQAGLGSAQSLYTASQNYLEPTVADSLLIEHPYWLNAYLAGYYGYLQLEKLAGHVETATIKSEYNRLLTLRINTFSKDLPTSYYSDCQYCRQLVASRNFIWLVPEVADALRPSLSTQINAAINEYNHNVPYWFVSQFDATIGEGALQNLYDYHAVFQAKAMLLQEPYEKLVKYLDVPAFARGDLFYIDNLVAALEAPASGAKTGDANGDQKVDGVDYVIWLNHYGQSVSGVTVGDFNNSGNVDGVDYVIWLTNYGT